ncbi:MAG: hypothetical protein ACLUD2_15110 [Clostridium sp.]
MEFKDQLYIIDQHAAHEKVLYEKTMNSLKTREYTCQQIQSSHYPDVGKPGDTDAGDDTCRSLRTSDLRLSRLDGKEYAVRGVPDNLFTIAKKELLMEMLDSLSEDTQARNADMIYEKVASHVLQGRRKGT